MTPTHRGTSTTAWACFERIVGLPAWVGYFLSVVIHMPPRGFSRTLFFGIGTVLLANTLVQHPRFGTWFAIPGAVAGFGALMCNLYTFPPAPAQAGLLDLGPAVGLWYVLVLARLGLSIHVPLGNDLFQQAA